MEADILSESLKGFFCGESLKGFFLLFTDCLTIGNIHETMVVHMTWVWTFFNYYSNIRACACWALLVVTLTNTVHLIYIYIYIWSRKIYQSDRYIYIWSGKIYQSGEFIFTNYVPLYLHRLLPTRLKTFMQSVWTNKWRSRLILECSKQQLVV